MADQVLYSGVACITDLMVKEGLINLDFADVRSVMREMGRAMMGTGEASAEGRAMAAAEAAISNPLLDETSMAGSQGLLISITGGRDMTLFEVDEAATRIREEVDPDANIILGATFDESLEGVIRVSVVATGIDSEINTLAQPNPQLMNDAAERLRQSAAARQEQLAASATPAATGSSETTAATAAPLAETASVEAELAIPEAPMLEIQRSNTAVPFAAESADFADPISDDEFQNMLEEQLSVMPSEPVAPAAPVKMPSAEDFPAVAQQQIGMATEPVAEDNGPMGLLKRLATGLGGSSHDLERAPVSRQAPATSAAPLQSAAPTPVREDNNPYAPPKNGALDVHGRAAPASKPINEDDQLDIPAFLRRQA